jgi:TPR repeat protein
MYETGRGVKRDISKAIHYLSLAAAQGNSSAKKRLDYVKNRLSKNVVVSEDKRINVEAWAYISGLKEEKDYEKAIALFKEAAELGNVKALHNLGYIYQYREDVEPNFELAAHFYAKAAALGLPDSQNNLAILYKRGLGVQKNKDVAISYFEQAAKSGFSESQYNLANILIKKWDKKATVKHLTYSQKLVNKRIKKLVRKLED